MRSILAILLLLGLCAVDFVNWKQYHHDAHDPLSSEQKVLLIHAILALAAATIGSLWLTKARWSTRFTLLSFFFIVALILPTVGTLIVAAMAWVLAMPAGDGLRPEDRYVFGNPPAIAARRETRSKDPELRPLCEAMRSFSAEELESMIHGLRHTNPRHHTLHFLRRFQVDANSNLQFASQGVITSNLEQLESRLKTITERLAASPTNQEAHLDAAEILLDLAEWTPQGDATSLVYLADALEHLRQTQVLQPNNQHSWRLAVEAHLGLDDAPAAMQALAKLPPSETTRLLEMRTEFLAGNYSQLPALATSLANDAPVLHEVLGFWNGSWPKPASLLPKSSPS